MTLLTLVPHPANPGDAIHEIVAAVERRADMLTLTYRAVGRHEEVRWPTALPCGFSDELWKHSCLEAFVGVAGNSGYVELNMASSRRWAAYRFDDYRRGMQRAMAAPTNPFVWTAPDATLTVRWHLPDLAVEEAWLLGLGAVIETLDGAKNYFALSHGPGDPDFHRRDCFTARLPVTGDH